MSYLTRAGRRLATLSFCLLFSMSSASAQTLYPTSFQQAQPLRGAVIDMLETWLDAHSTWPRREAPPRIERITAQQAALIAGRPGRGHGATRGLYDPDTETIYLVQPWDAGNPEDMAVLLHELVHHRQAPHHFYCPAAQEEGAYRAQEAWMASLGLDADIDWLVVTLEAGCTPRDIHPE